MGSPLSDSSAADTEAGRQLDLLRRERDLLRRLVNQLPEELFVKDCEGKVLLANEAKVKAMGFASEADLLGKSVFDIFSPEDAALFRKDEQRVTEDGVTLMDYKQWVLPREGRLRRFSDSKIPMIDSSGVIEGYLGIWRDITESYQTHHDLLREKALMQSFFDLVPNRIYFKDQEGRYLRVNRAFLAACGIADEKEVLGKTAFDFFEKDYAEKTRRDELQILQGGGLLLGMVDKQVRKGGGCTWAVTSEMPLRDHEDRIVGTMGISHDITELRKAEDALRESEALFRSVWDKSQDGMRLTDAEGTIIAVNEAFCRLYHQEREQLVGRSLVELYAPEHAEGLVQGYRQRFEGDGQSGIIPLRRKLWDGREVEMEISYAKLEPASGHYLYLSILRDVTLRNQNEAKQYELEKKMLETQRLESLGLMAGGVAHDFNNMLTGIFGHLGLAVTKLPQDSVVRQDLHRVERICMQAAELCRKMLVYSGGNRFEIKPVDLNDILTDMGDLLEISLAKDIRIHYRWQQPLPLVQGDVSQIRQVALNLVINAAESIGDQAGEIQVSTGLMDVDEAFLLGCCHEGAKPGPYVYLEVSDSGCGMNEETLARIFEPFYSTKFTGRGLGLAAVQGIVKGHQGALHVKSAPGQGSLFRFLIPRDVISAAPIPVKAPASVPSGGGGLVLLVDDEESIRLVVTKMLEGQGYEIVPACDGQEALQLFFERPGDWKAVIMDRTMPRLNGDEALSIMRQARADVPALLMSGYSIQDPLKPLHGPHHSDFLVKPFRMQDLLQKLERLIRGPE